MQIKRVRMKMRIIERILTGIQSPNRILPNAKQKELLQLNELMKDTQVMLDSLSDINLQFLLQEELDELEAERRSVLAELLRPELPLIAEYA